MLLTVKRLGRTNISLRRFARGRRGWRLSPGGCGRPGISAATLTRRSYRSYACDSARLLRRRGAGGIRRAAALPQAARNGQVVPADVGSAGEPFSASGVDVEAQVPAKAVLGQDRARPFPELHACGDV